MARRLGIEIGARGARRTGKQIGGVTKDIDRMKQRARAASNAMSSLWGAIGGIGIAAGAKQLFDYQNSIAGLAAKARLSTDEAKALSAQVLEVSAAHNIAKEEVKGALDVFQDFGDILKDGQKILEQLGKRATASSTSIRDLATVSAALVDSGLTPEQSVAALDQLIAQADAGTVAMSDLSRVIAEVVKVGGTMGQRFQGMSGVKQIGELMQVAGSVFAGNADQARTSVRALFRDLTAKSKELKKMGISVFDADGMRDVQTIMQQIISKTGGGAEAMSKIFTADSQAIAAAFASSFSKESGKFIGVVEKVSGATGDAATIDEMYKRRMGGVAAEAVKVEQALKRLQTDLLEVGGKLVTWIDQNRGTAIAAGVGGILAAKMLPGALGKVLAGKPGAAGAGGGLGGGLGGGPVPVYIVGGPGEGVAGGLSAAGKSGQQAAKGLGRLRSVLGKVASAAGPVIAAFTTGWSLGTALDQLTGMSDKISDFFFDLLNGGEAARRRLTQELETNTWGRDAARDQKSYLTGKNADTVEALKERAAFYAERGGLAGRNEKTFESDIRRTARDAGMSEADITALLPEMKELVKTLKSQKQQPVNVNVQGPAGLDKPKAQVSRGPSFLSKD